VTLKFAYRGKTVGVQLKQNLDKNYQRIADASRGAMQEARGVILKEGAADIRKGGNFGNRWVKSLTSELTPERGRTVNLILNTFHKIPYANIFEYGGIIKGKPLLWIPLSFANIKIRARDWAKRYGGLFRVDRKGGKAPLLLSVRTGEPKYFGKESVKQKRRFQLRPIIKRTAAKLGTFYRKAYRNGRR
jgi:hypothetical protein